MKKIQASIFAFLIFFSFSLMATDVVGFWKNYDEKTGKPQIIVAVYEYQDKYYSRIIASFNNEGILTDSIYAPVSRSTRLVGDPFYAGLDFIWGLQKRGSKYTGGEILDPRKGKTYNAEMWTKGDQLIVRGKLLCFGKNLTWAPVTNNDFPADFVKPDLTQFVPSIPQAK